MKDWLTRVASHLEDQFDSRRLREIDPQLDRVTIVPFRSYGTRERFFLRGRVLVEKKIIAAEDQPAWRNLVDSWRRFESDEIPGARVEATWRDVSAVMTCDDEGYFIAEMETRASETIAGWQTVSLRLLDPPVEEVTAEAHVLVPNDAASFAVISDLDDTVIESNVTRKLAMLREVVLGNAATRTPFEGVAEFYAALRGVFENPIFYVSGGPWNLYDLYHGFIELHRVPHGPILLADFGLAKNLLIHPEHHVHKKEKIAHIFETYPSMPFVLIGDSGEHDPEIYLDIARMHGSRVKAIYIRDVVSRDLKKIGDDVRALGSELVVIQTASEAMLDAAARGLIRSP